MHALGHTTVVGDTTAGETGSPFSRELQNGWTYQFPESIEYTLDGRTFEDIGLAPDVPVLNTSAQIVRNVDAQLARAIALAQGKP
jgi:C-terminal processing protease CtpA/Prc